MFCMVECKVVMNKTDLEEEIVVLDANLARNSVVLPQPLIL